MCGNIYVDEKDSQGFDRLIPIELGTRQQSLRPGFGTDPLRSSSQDKGKSVARDETPVVRLTRPYPFSCCNLQE